jgi:flagellar biosynthesis protein FliQ
MNNSLVYGLIFGLLLAPGFIGLQLVFFSSLVRKLKLDVKFDKPVEVLSLIISEIITILFSLKSIFTPSFYYPLIVVVLLSTMVYGLWKLKKWVVYVYLFFSIVTQLNYFLSGMIKINDLKLSIASLISQILTLLIYYFYVYKPNKKRFK